MVFSSSTVTMAALGKSPFLQLLNQGAFCLIGLVLGFVALMMMPVTFWKRTGVFEHVVGACLLQALTFTPLGRRLRQQRLAGPRLHHYPAGRIHEVRDVHMASLVVACLQQDVPQEGNQSICRAVGAVCDRRGTGDGRQGPRHGHDSGLHRAVAFLIVGFPGKWMGVGVLGAVVMVGGALAVSSPNRLRRILATYGDCSAADAQGVCYQSIHAKYAIASGGFWDWASAIRGRNGITAGRP